MTQEAQQDSNLEGESTASAPSGTADGAELRVLVLAPVGRDGPLTVKALEERGIRTCLCTKVEAVCDEIAEGAGLLVLAAEALDARSAAQLAEELRRQPPWSDLPVLLITTADANYERQVWDFEQGNVTVLQRPLRLQYLLSAVEAGLRARRRQYEVRDLLEQTEQARVEAERQHAEIELLNERLRRSMRETHHRVKNNLQVIAAMIDMQILEGKAQIPSSELRRLGSHVRTLATVHDMLTHQARQDGEAHHVSSRAILNELVPLIQQSSGDREVRMRADDVRLSARQSASLAIVVNELVSNAVKHGRGVIDIELRAEDGCLILQVSDKGDGFPKGFNPVKAANTGLELIEHLAAWDLGGEVQYGNAPGGGGVVTIHIPFPVSKRKGMGNGE